MIEAVLPEGLSVQVRELGATRVLSAQYDGPRALIEPLIDELTTRAINEGLGPCGPVLLDFPDYADPRSEARLSARVMVPVRGSSDDEGLAELPPMRVAQVHYLGEAADELHLVHESLFAWMDSEGHPRQARRHLHAYLTGGPADLGNPAAEICLELRFPIFGSHPPRPPLCALGTEEGTEA